MTWMGHNASLSKGASDVMINRRTRRTKPFPKFALQLACYGDASASMINDDALGVADVWAGQLRL